VIPSAAGSAETAVTNGEASTSNLRGPGGGEAAPTQNGVISNGVGGDSDEEMEVS